jgi:putative ABC transport system substrate-binding protein
VKRREFITLLGGAAVWPLAAGAQQPKQMKRIGVITPFNENDSESQRRVSAFRQGLQELGWTDGRNVRFDYRGGAGDPDRIRAYAAEIVRLKPDVILANSAQILLALQRETRTISIVFVQVDDPVSNGIVSNLAHPGGNITGFTPAESPMGGK